MPSTRAHLSGLPLTRHTLDLWLHSPRGRRLLALEEGEVRRVLPEVFGRHVLQIGSWGLDNQLINYAETLHKAVLGTVGGEPSSALIDPEQLPLMSKSVDAVLLPHTLEFSRSPHNVLREVNRVLNDRGRLFVLGFSPWSSWALRSLVGLRYRAFPAGARFHGVGRICDWLELLDCEVTEIRRFGVGKTPDVKQIVIHTDGACRGNPGPGGWGALLEYNGTRKDLKGGEALTTNNRMELMAAISALEALREPCAVQLYTDSVYVRSGLLEWLPGWKKRGWKTADKKPVKNQDLWQRLDAAASRHQVEWHWVKGHAGHPGNEAADRLANEGIDELLAQRRGAAA